MLVESGAADPARLGQAIHQGDKAMSNDPSFVADRLVWRFKKSGAEGAYSKAFQSFPEQVQESVRRGAELGENEAPAVLCYRSDATWTLLTNARIVWREGSGLAGSI